MKWILCGLTFAMAVVLAIGTASVGADNARRRFALDRDFRQLEARSIELQRLRLLSAAQSAPDRLVVHLRQLLAQPGVVPTEAAPCQ